MIQFNLLPDVKLNYIRARRLKRTVVVASIAVGSASLTVLTILVLLVNFWQVARIDGLKRSIDGNVKKLQSIQDLDKILTVQNQLNSLPGLHDQKPVTTRLFGYISQLTPSSAAISETKLDFDTNTITISGSADSLATVNRYVDTLKFTTYKVKDAKDSPKAFDSVVLSNFGKDDKGATYEITAQFDKAIFDSVNPVVLKVPDIISTRSETEKPTDLFQKSSTNPLTGATN